MSRAENERQERVHTRLQDARELIRPISGASEERQRYHQIMHCLNPAWKLNTTTTYTWTARRNEWEGKSIYSLNKYFPHRVFRVDLIDTNI